MRSLCDAKSPYQYIDECWNLETVVCLCIKSLNCCISQCTIWKLSSHYAWFKRMFWNDVFCPIVLYTNLSTTGCVFTHLRRAKFLPLSSEVPYMLRFSSHFCNSFYIRRQKPGVMLMRGDTFTSACIFLSHNGTKYMIPKHALKPGISCYHNQLLTVMCRHTNGASLKLK